MGYLAPCWELLGQFGGHFGDILPKRLQSKKPAKTLGFLRFWLLWGCPGGGLEASWRSCWPMLASSSASMLHFRAMLGHLGDKMAIKMGKMAAKSAKMSQDGPTWAAKAIEGRPGSAPTGPESGLREAIKSAVPEGASGVTEQLHQVLSKVFCKSCRTLWSFPF